MAKKTKSAKRGKLRERRERRFEPRASASPSLVYLLGALGAVAMGAGTWGEFGSLVRDASPEPFKYAAYVLAVGAVLVGIAIWIGTSGEAPLRVGDGGIAVERGGLRRMPWYAVERIGLADGAVRVTGNDDSGESMTVVASMTSHPQAAAWIIKEARERVPTAVQLPEDAMLPDPRVSAGESLAMDPPQVVGKHCADSGTVIAYEPDARVCPRCERVYHRAHVPDSCACGASLEAFKAQTKTG
jgi:hypothetical protein